MSVQGGEEGEGEVERRVGDEREGEGMSRKGRGGMVGDVMGGEGK